MSRQQNKHGWKPPSYLSLRQGQKRLYEKLSTVEKNIYAVQLPTGYGKSWCAAIAYATLRGQGRVNRMLLVVPTGTQRSQYIADFEADLSNLVIDYRGIERCDVRVARAIKKSLRNESDIFVTTVQSIRSSGDWFDDLMSKGNWLVVADEFHHYGEDNSWGSAIKELNYSALMGMSATPIRGDKTPTILGDIPFDVQVTVPDAIKEKALRPICGIKCEYDVTFGTADDEDPQTVTLSELSDSLIEGASEWEIKCRVRYYTKYVSSILTQAINAWMEYEHRDPGQNQMLVFAMSCRHAESICKTINDLAFPGLPKPFAEWVGTGEGESESRTNEQNRQIIDQFQRNELPCLVQVNLAGEGFNNKRCSIGVMLDLVGDTPMKRQHFGRFMRVNPKAPNQIATIFVSTDSPCIPLLESIEEQTLQDPSGEKNPGNNSGNRDYSCPEIPDIIIIDTEYKHQTPVYPYGTLESTIEAFKDQNPAAANVPDTEIATMLEQWADKRSGFTKTLTSDERWKQVSEQVNRHVGALVNILLSKRYGKKFPSSAKKDYFRLIHGHYSRYFAKAKQQDLTEDELLAKNAWLQELRAQIVKGDIPSWLNM